MVACHLSVARRWLIILPKKHRLTSKCDFQRVKRFGRTYKSPFFSVAVAKAKNVGDLRFGFIVSTKFSKKAVVRNRAKRLLREVVRSKLESFPVGYDIVFLVRKDILGVGYEEVSVALDKVLSEISFS